MLRVILTTILVGLLSACTSVGPGPGVWLVQQAIALQLSQTQAQLTQQLHLSQPPQFEIERVAIKKQEPLTIEDLQAFRVRGTYDLKIKLSKREIRQQQKPFEVYLQRQQQAKTWRLARPLTTENNAEQTWATYQLEPRS